MSLAAPSCYIKYLDCRNTAMLVHCPFFPPEHRRIRKVNDEVYYITSTQEFGFYKPKAETKGDSLDSVRKSFNRLKALINCNYDSPDQIKYITLTYAENMTDNSQLRKDLQPFFRKMHRMYGDFEYLYVKEQQGRGAWHIHMVLFFPCPAPYMPNNDDDHPVRDAWSHGFVNVKGFSNDINNLGNYLCAYLTDDKAESKKGGRLMNYESGIKLYNCSRGVKRPVSSCMTYEQYLDFVSDEENLLISDSETSIVFDSGQQHSIKRELYAKI